MLFSISPGQVVVADTGPGTTGRSVAMATIDAGRRGSSEAQFTVEILDHIDTSFQLVCHLAQLLHCAHVLYEDSLLHEPSTHQAF